MNREILDMQAGFRKGRGTRDQISNICWIIEKARECQEKKKKHKTSTSLDMLKPLTVDHIKLWKILKKLGIPDHLPRFLRNLYADQEATVRTEHGTLECSKIKQRKISRLYVVTLLI